MHRTRPRPASRTLPALPHNFPFPFPVILGARVLGRRDASPESDVSCVLYMVCGKPIPERAIWREIQPPLLSRLLTGLDPAIGNLMKEFFSWANLVEPHSDEPLGNPITLALLLSSFSVVDMSGSKCTRAIFPTILGCMEHFARAQLRQGR